MSRKNRKFKLGPIEEDILQNLSAGDFLMSFLLSARSSRLLHHEAYKRARIRYSYNRSAEGLKRDGILKIQGDMILATNKGRELINILNSKNDASMRTWTGTWQIVLYDIPVTMNAYRLELRRILVRSGFRKLQQSVWIHHRHSAELEAFLKDNPSMSKFVRYLEAHPFAHVQTIKDWEKLPPA